MLKPDNRLKKTRDFNLLFTHGRWLRGNFFDLKYLDLAKSREIFPKNTDPKAFAKQIKFAFAAGIKISKKATQRNRLKRVLREAVRLLVKEKPVREGYYGLFVVRPGSLSFSLEQARTEAETLLKKAGILKK